MLTDFGNAKSCNPWADNATSDFKEDNRRKLQIDNVYCHSEMIPSGWNTEQCWQTTAKGVVSRPPQSKGGSLSRRPLGVFAGLYGTGSSRCLI